MTHRIAVSPRSLGIAAAFLITLTPALSCLALSSSAGVGSRILRERLTRLIPLIGAVSAGVLNYAAVQTVARAAIRYYDARIDPDLAAEIWAEGDREHA